MNPVLPTTSAAYRDRLKRLAERARLEFPHRLAMSPDTCPACCGSGETVGSAFRAPNSEPIRPAPIPGGGAIFPCFCTAEAPGGDR